MRDVEGDLGLSRIEVVEEEVGCQLESTSSVNKG